MHRCAACNRHRIAGAALGATPVFSLPWDDITPT